MKKYVLIVDDEKINRSILNKILSQQYQVLEAQNGAEALAVMRAHCDQITIVMLDLVMPVMNGYEMLEEKAKDPELAAIPVIVTSQSSNKETEVQALKLGARDFVPKPYEPSVLLARVANLIELRESNSCIRQIERDPLTGLYNKVAFCRYAQTFLSEASNPESYHLLSLDIDQFKLINDRLGAEEGDRVLKLIATHFRECIEEHGGLCGRLYADHLAAILPSSPNKKAMEQLVNCAENRLKQYRLGLNLSVRFGVYRIDDVDTPIELMCDRAVLAADEAKTGNYSCAYAFYNDDVRKQLIREQKITNDMRNALEEGQFQVYLQPKYDLQSEKIAGAEALVRWLHPVMGFMNPGEFIPVFEKNGFISELDQYMWEQTCAIMADWQHRGIPAVPVSVNVSRRDIYQQDLPEIFSRLVEQYCLQPPQLHLEITETAYTENPEQLISVVGELRRRGFVIEMDDFGSGYSSLNMLSELPMDIIKLDMRFIQKENEKNGSRSILSFIVSLAKWMSLLVVAEGVETREQIDLLRNMDCNYVQGYYYAKPMPAAQFTANLSHSEVAVPIPKSFKDWDSGNLIIRNSTGDKTMLIVDDIELNRAVLRSCFEERYGIVEADNGKVAYEYLLDHGDEVAIIMLDLIMPVMDGFQFLQKVRATERLSQIPVIVTSQAGETSEANAFELGASDFLPKPYNIEIARHRVENVLAHSTMRLMEQEKEMKHKLMELSKAASHDQLTGLHNRSEMEQRVDAYFASGSPKAAFFFMLDIDNFKLINDTYGHDRGDQAIQSVAERLQTAFRGEDLLCRMGGDEFSAFLQADLDKRGLVHRLERMSAVLQFAVDDIQISCSIGVCEAPLFAQNYQELYHNADTALLTAKRLGKNQYQIYGEGKELPEQILYRNMDWLLDESSDAVFVCNAQTYELYYLNEVAGKLSGKSKKDCLSQPCYQAIWNKTEPCEHCVRISQMSHDYCEHEVHVAETGKSYIIKGKLITWGNRQARIQYVQDNTSKAALLSQLQSVKEDQQKLLNLLPGGMIRYDIKTKRFSFISDSLLRMLGYTQAEFDDKFGNCVDQMVWHEDRDQVLSDIRLQAQTHEYGSCQYRVEKKDGTLCWVYATGYHYAKDQIDDCYAVLSDISALKQAEEKNISLQRNLETVINNVPGALCMYRWDGAHLQPEHISPQFYDILGVDVDLAKHHAGETLIEPVNSDDLIPLRTAMRALLLNNCPLDQTFRIYHARKQKMIWLRMQAAGRVVDNGQVMVYVLYTDVSDMAQLRKELGQQRDMLSAAIQHSGMVCWIYDFSDHTVHLDDKTCEKMHLPKTLSSFTSEFTDRGIVDEKNMTCYREMLKSLDDGRDSAEVVMEIGNQKTGAQKALRLVYTVVSRKADGTPLQAIGTAMKADIRRGSGE